MVPMNVVEVIPSPIPSVLVLAATANVVITPKNPYVKNPNDVIFTRLYKLQL